MNKMIKNHLPVERISPEGKHCFFGYFDKYPWDRSQRYLLGHQIDFMGRQPEVGEKAAIGMYDLDDQNKFVQLAETLAWNWQQFVFAGCCKRNKI